MAETADGITFIDVVVPGIAYADAFDAGNAFGTIMKLRVPERGILYSAEFLDVDLEGTEIDLFLSRREFTGIASDAAFALTGEMIQGYLTWLQFTPTITVGTTTTIKVSQLQPLKPYHAPLGYLWAQCMCVGTPNIASGKDPRIQFGFVAADGAGLTQRV